MSLDLSDREFARLNGPAPAWWGGASVDEVLAFRLGREWPGDGSAIRLLDGEELERQLVLVRVRLRASLATSWLEKYGRLLVEEWRRRHSR